jgi:hypothetical protein
MEHGFYHPVNGYWQTISTPTDEHLSAYPEGTIEVPIRPSPLHTWGGTEWFPPTQEVADADAAMVVRATRNTILVNTVDPIVSNPLRWADLTAEKKGAWSAYRRALLDISQQSGFPHDVVWPVAPEGV